MCEPKGKLGQCCETVIHSATHQIIHNCKSQTAEMKLLDLSVMVGYSSIYYGKAQSLWFGAVGVLHMLSPEINEF